MFGLMPSPGCLALLLLLVQRRICHAFAQQLQVGMGEHEREKGGVLIRKTLVNLLLLVLPFAPLFIDKDDNGQRQTNDGHQVARSFNVFKPGHGWVVSSWPGSTGSGATPLAPVCSRPISTVQCARVATAEAKPPKVRRAP